MKKQVKEGHYDFNKYVNKKRFMSYYYQLKLIYELKPKSILEIGTGNNFLKKLLSDEFEYKTLDFDKSLKPDIVGSVTNIPLKNNSFDLVVCFQVLEHLPFEQFETALKEIQRVTKKHAIISLPYSHAGIQGNIRIAGLGTFGFSITFPKFYKKHKFDGQHYWEIGRKGYSLKKIKSILGRHFQIKEMISPQENKYHLFFRLIKI